MFLKKVAIACWLAMLPAFGVLAQLQPGNPADAGFSPERLGLIDQMLQQYTSKEKVAGTVALIARHGKIVYHHAAGYSDVEAGRQMKPDDLFRIASQTKEITAAAVMMLYEEGRLLLEDPVSRYIPEFAKAKVLKSFNEKDTTYETEPAKREITVRDLLTHTSGISYAVIGSKEGRAIYAKENIPIGFEPRRLELGDRMKALAKLPLMHQPGERYTYSLAMDVLGYIVEVISGKSFKDFLQERIFDPLAMRDTYFYVPPAKQSRLSKIHKFDSKGKLIQNVADDSAGINTIYPLVNGTYYSGGAGLVSTAQDYATFLQMLANGGIYNGKRLLSPATVRLMTTNQIDEKVTQWSSNDGFGFTFGVIGSTTSTNYPWNPGTYFGGGFWGSFFWVDPVAGIVAQIWSNGGGFKSSEMTNKFKVMVYGALVEPEKK